MYAAVVLALGLVTLPGMLGTWVYDDIKMLENPMSDDASDIPAVFVRNSGHYLSRGATIDTTSGVTYRPLTHLTLVTPHALIGPVPLPHHVVGLLLHALVAMLVLGLDRRLHGRSTGAGVAAAGLVALHPALAEAWVWINGRSDLVAGVVVAAAALVAFPRGGATPAPAARHFALTAVFCSLAVLAKEPAIIAAAAVFGAAALPARAPWIERAPIGPAAFRFAAAVAGSVVALVVYLALRANTLADSPPVAFAGGSSVGSLLGRAPLLVAIALETLVTPIPRPMRLLAWETLVGWTPARAALLTTAGMGLLVLLFTGRLRALVLLGGALLCLLPTGHVAEHDWMGFDRYLYMPLLLGMIALVIEVQPAPAGAISRPTRIAGAAVAALLAVGLHAQSRVYHSQLEWTAAILDGIPESGAGHLRLAEFHLANNNPALAAQAMEALPLSASLPAAVLHSAAAKWLRLGVPSRAVEVVELAAATYPDNVLVAYDVLAVRQHQRRWDELERIAAPLLASPRDCAPALALVDAWLATPGALDDAVRPRFEAMAAASACHGR